MTETKRTYTAHFTQKHAPESSWSVTDTAENLPNMIFGAIQAGAICTHINEVVTVKAPTRCTLHSSFEADYCPRCGTAQVIGR